MFSLFDHPHSMTQDFESLLQKTPVYLLVSFAENACLLISVQFFGQFNIYILNR